MAGTGKSTIADTLYQIARRRQEPTGDFFCTRDFEDARNVSRIIPTLAYRLAFKLPACSAAPPNAFSSAFSPRFFNLKFMAA